MVHRATRSDAERAQDAAAEERAGPVQGRLYRSARLWAFYCDLEESLGTLESTRAVYDRILDLRIATPQIVLNYAAFLQARPPRAQCSWATRRCSSCGAAQPHRLLAWQRRCRHRRRGFIS